MSYKLNGDTAVEEGCGIQHEPLTIVGMGCCLPGQASSPSDLWHLLMQNKSGHCAVPKMRYNAEGFYHPNADRPGSINSTGGYFLQEDPRLFENAFFGINNLEASSMNAQQRKLLGVVYESFASGGVPATGSGPTILSNRVTHCFDLRGPSVVLDTACSSSIYALHFACLTLDARDCGADVVASANLIQTPEQQLFAVKAGILSPDSTCHTFDESANMCGRADGVPALYLKRLSDAVRDGDPIRSVIRGTAVNGNGCTPGIAQSSIDGQEAVIRAAYRRAQTHPGET
ncbi:thiolase-like protein [Xylaria digitata]|nr:thiolase-like protein [Xylaria digitata]